MKKVYLYIRFSSSKQAFGDSVRRQKASAMRWCRENDLDFEKLLTYEDLGKSAFFGANAASGQLSLFLESLHSGDIPKGSILLVESLDRLSRDSLINATALLRELVTGGIEVITLIDKKRWNSESLNNMMEFMYSIMLFSRANEESATKSQRMVGVYQGRRDRGEGVICNIAPGWLQKDLVKKCWVLNIEKSESVRKVFAAYIKGLGLASICSIANKEGWAVPSFRNPDGWHVSRVKRLISSRAVLGEYIQKDGSVIPDFFPRVISDDDYNRAQAVGFSRSKMPRRRDAESLNVLQGKLVCGNCGASFVLKNKGRRYASTKEPYTIYMCANRVRSITKCPTWPNGTELMKATVAFIYQGLADQISVDSLLKNAYAERQAAEDAIADANTRLNRITELVTYSTNPVKSLGPQFASAEKDLADAESRLKTAKAKISSLKMTNLELDSIEEGVNAAVESLETPEGRDQVRLKILEYVDTVFVYPQHKTIGLTFLNQYRSIVWWPLGEDLTALEHGLQLPSARGQ